LEEVRHREAVKAFNQRLQVYHYRMSGVAPVDSVLPVTLRDVLCASLSLDDALSAILASRTSEQDIGDTAYEIARAIEEILLRRPGLASSKLTALTVRLSFEPDRELPELLMLLDTRYTSSYRRSEAELQPDIDAIPRLIDILGELLQSMGSALRLNLRPLATILTDEILLTLEAIYNRFHQPSTLLALHEIHYLTFDLMESGLFECAEGLLNRLLAVARQLELRPFMDDVAFDEACALTELGMFSESRRILQELESNARLSSDVKQLALIALQLSMNDTRDDGIPYETARSLADKAAALYRDAIASGKEREENLGVALLDIGSSILATGWREGVPQAIQRLESASKVCTPLKDKNTDQMLHEFKCLAGLGFAHGLMGDHENMAAAVGYLEQAKKVLQEIGSSGQDFSLEMSRCDHTLGWVCLCSDSDEFWPTGVEALKRAVKTRESLLSKGGVTELELLGSQVGLAISLLRMSNGSDAVAQESLRESLARYMRLFPTDPRAYTEAAIATYNAAWFSLRHGSQLPPRLLGTLEEVDRMLSDIGSPEDNIFVSGASLVVPYLTSGWSQLSRRSKKIIADQSELSGPASVMMGLAAAKINQHAVSLESGLRVMSPADEFIRLTDPLLAQYWEGQARLAQTIRLFYENKSFSELAAGLYQAAVALRAVEKADSTLDEASEFIRATADSLSTVILRFATALEKQYGTLIDRTKYPTLLEAAPEGEFGFILAEDWLNMMKLTDSYLQMVEQAEFAKAQPYMNAVFSNIARAFRMMDSASMVDRRVLAFLGEEMNRRFYFRR